MAELKTKLTGDSVTAFLNKIPDEGRGKIVRERSGAAKRKS